MTVQHAEAHNIVSSGLYWPIETVSVHCNQTWGLMHKQDHFTWIVFMTKWLALCNGPSSFDIKCLFKNSLLLQSQYRMVHTGLNKNALLVQSWQLGQAK